MNNKTELYGKTFAQKAALPYVYIAIAVLLCYILLGPILRVQGHTIEPIMLAGVLLCAIYALFNIPKKPSAGDRIIRVIIIAGTFMRIGYMLYTPYMLRGHDIGSMQDSGHLSYIYNIYKTWSLPDTNSWQYYHPPLQHFAEAVVVKIFSLFQTGVPTVTLFEAAKIVPCFASCAVMLVCRSICEEAGLSRRAAVISLLIIAFHPTFYFKAADINNDTLMLLFYMAAILYTIRWYYRQIMKNILFIALFIGLSMMTKLSGCTAAFFTGAVFVIVSIQRIRAKRCKGLLGQYAAFAGVCAPLGLWHPVRNLILFGQPIGYVFDLGPESILYCGDHSVSARFLSFPPDQIFNRLYCHMADDYNVWTFTLKCSVFGEYTFKQDNTLAAAFLAINFAAIAISLAAMIYVMARCKDITMFVRFGLFFIWLIQVVFYIVFNIKYPQVCTMDFRYMIPTAIIGAMYIGIALGHLKKSGRAAAGILYIIGCILIMLFVIGSAVFYTGIAF